MNPTILVVSDNENTCSQIESEARKQTVECYVASYGDHLAELVKKMNPFLLIVEFNSEGSDWIIKHLGTIKANNAYFPIVGLIHEDQEGDEYRLQKAGCDRVIKRNTFNELLPSIIEHYYK